VEDLCKRISERAAELKAQLAHAAELSIPTPCPKFDPDGTARIEGWRPKRKAKLPEVSCETDVRDGRPLLHLRTTNGPLLVTLSSPVSLQAGRYQLTGQIIMANALGPTNSISAVLLRNSTTRFGVERHRLNAENVSFSFEVSEERAPEEIEFVCEMRDASAEAWFDASALRLTPERR
jgi:hypothetical protein